jgi:flagellar L-ring protein FlgH
MKRNAIALVAAIALAAAAPARATRPKKEKQTKSALDLYVESAMSHNNPAGPQTAPGSLFNPANPLSDLARDPKASQVDDLVTIVVAEKASATSTGTTNTARKSDLSATVSALAGATPAAGALANLAGMSGDSKLQGQGTTSRETVLTTTLAARVTHVLPNGYMVLEGSKEIVVNSERQMVTVRGVLRPSDLTPGNLARSDRLAQMEIRINGKGVVGDAIRRPFILYRLLMGLLPF